MSLVSELFSSGFHWCFPTAREAKWSCLPFQNLERNILVSVDLSTDVSRLNTVPLLPNILSLSVSLSSEHSESCPVLPSSTLLKWSTRTQLQEKLHVVPRAAVPSRHSSPMHSPWAFPSAMEDSGQRSTDTHPH